MEWKRVWGFAALALVAVVVGVYANERTPTSGAPVPRSMSDGVRRDIDAQLSGISADVKEIKSVVQAYQTPAPADFGPVLASIAEVKTGQDSILARLKALEVGPKVQATKPPVSTPTSSTARSVTVCEGGVCTTSTQQAYAAPVVWQYAPRGYKWKRQR